MFSQSFFTKNVSFRWLKTLNIGLSRCKKCGKFIKLCGTWHWRRKFVSTGGWSNFLQQRRSIINLDNTFTLSAFFWTKMTSKFGV